MRRPVALALWLVCAASAWPVLRPGDPSVADQSWETAERIAGDDPGAKVWVDAAWFQLRVAPGQEAWPRARARLAQVGAQRRALLPDDRGGRRRPPPELAD